ncbi:hypothetical protein OIU78_007423 [Salix suchowensis]|nr:hypothetical protein OIU78_007423 [Salix suchowensis]
MYSSEKPRPLDFYKEEIAPSSSRDNMIIEVISSNGDLQPLHLHPTTAGTNPHQMILCESSGDDNHEVKAPKKRAETWVQDETRSLIGFRREMDGLFNTSKSNKHLWEQISTKMREKGFDRSPTMCTDKWRNLLKEYKKAKHQNRGGGSAKMSYYMEIDEILRGRNKNSQYKCTVPSKVDPYMQFTDKESIAPRPSASCPNLAYCVTETLRLALKIQVYHLDHWKPVPGHQSTWKDVWITVGIPLAITAADAVAASGVPPWNWRETPGNVAESQSYGGRVISVKSGDYTRRIGIDGTADAIREAIKSAFRLRTKRAFWLEDEDQIIRALDRDMPLGSYTLHLDEGLAIKVYLYDESDHLPVHTEEKIFYTEDDYRDFLSRRGWTCLREFDGYRNIDSMDDLRHGAIYRGVS